MPRALPPFLLNCAIMFKGTPWMAIEGVIPEASLTLFDSSMKIATMSVRRVGLFFTIPAQYVWLRSMLTKARL